MAEFCTLKILFIQLESLYLHASSTCHWAFPNFPHRHLILVTSATTWHTKTLRMADVHLPLYSWTTLVTTIKSKILLWRFKSSEKLRFVKCWKVSKDRSAFISKSKQSGNDCVYLSCLPVDTVSHPIRLESSATPLLELHISNSKLWSLTLEADIDKTQA
jgi:hypothetical protein